ncbi:MAG: hypothetical protein M3O09_03245 [Acidobacteriota bacterium]|nr:hypothetical protein [Acidobacteriota bacterium]
MSELHKAYRSAVNGLAAQPNLCPEIPAGVHWKLLAYHDGKPYIKAECGRCKQSIFSDSIMGMFAHCGMRETAPQHIVERYEARLPKRSFFERLLNPEPVPNI